jgi:hypothetical protein
VIDWLTVVIGFVAGGLSVIGVQQVHRMRQEGRAAAPPPAPPVLDDDHTRVMYQPGQARVIRPAVPPRWHPHD